MRRTAIRATCAAAATSTSFSTSATTITSSATPGTVRLIWLLPRCFCWSIALPSSCCGLVDRDDRRLRCAKFRILVRIVAYVEESVDFRCWSLPSSYPRGRRGSEGRNVSDLQLEMNGGGRGAICALLNFSPSTQRHSWLTIERSARCSGRCLLCC